MTSEGGSSPTERREGPSALPYDEGFLTIGGYMQYFRSYGQRSQKPTVLCLHGGPGARLDYLLPLADLSRHGYRVVLFDQLGCGRSELPTDRSLFTIDHHVGEVEEVRTVLDLGVVHLMGSSYGGLLALAYALAHPKGLRSLVISGGLASVPLTQAEMNRLIDELPAATRDTLRRYGSRGEFEHPEYLQATDVFYRTHMCRLAEWPAEVELTLSTMSGPVYHTMNGPNEFTLVGTIKDVDLTPRLHEIHHPTLITVGQYDEVTPTVAESIHQHIRGSRLLVLPNTSHMHMWEARETYIRAVASFLDGVA